MDRIETMQAFVTVADHKGFAPAARKLLGTIYLPNSELEITGAGDVAQESAYTIIIADKIHVRESRLVVNANYAATDVPVPAGLGPNSGQITLEQ